MLRTIAMRLAVPPEHRRFSFFQAFAARLGGESLSFLTFAGPLLGEATKVALLRKRVPLLHGVPALVVDNLLYNLSVVLVVFGVMLTTQGPFITMKTGPAEWAIAGLVGLLLFGVLVFSVIRTRGETGVVSNPPMDNPEHSISSAVLGEALLGLEEATPRSKL